MAQIRKSLPKGTSVELWWADEARVGQQTQLTRRWAKRGTRPSAARDQRRSSAWIFGAICPAEGKAAAIVMPRCNSEAMSMHLEEIAFHVAPGAHAVLLLDQAGWHASAELVVPSNITLMPLPPHPATRLAPLSHRPRRRTSRSSASVRRAPAICQKAAHT